MKNFLKTTALFAILLGLAGGLTHCEKIEDKEVICDVENPLTDLPWLKEKIAQYEASGFYSRIYQCTYKHGIGFLDIAGSMNFFYNCAGEVICILGGFAGNTCPELEIDFENKKLIWEASRITPCIEFEDPIRDIPWLAVRVREMMEDVEAGLVKNARIYQCVFSDGIREGIGFLTRWDGSPGYRLINCTGTPLCWSDDLCSDFTIDFENKKLIWEASRVNPCDCIMDTLRGEWRWVKTINITRRDTVDNEFESIVRILSQNEDGSINYEIFVEDTLFYRGSFEILQASTVGVFTNIKLPHRPGINQWNIFFRERCGTSGRDVISFQIGAAHAFVIQHYYQRVK
jgi:hypothetical protein